MRPRNLPHWVISLSLPLTGVSMTACTSDQEAGEMEEFDQGGDAESTSEGDSSMKNKKKKKKMMGSKKKKSSKTMKAGPNAGKKKKKMMKKKAPAASQDDMNMEADPIE